MPYHVLASIGGALNRQKKSVNGARVLILGVAYKKDIDDLRESPALTIIELLQNEGAQVSYHDPYFPFIGKGRKYDLQMKRTELEQLGQYDCVVIVTDHSDYDYRQDRRRSPVGCRHPQRDQGHRQSQGGAVLTGPGVARIVGLPGRRRKRLALGVIYCSFLPGPRQSPARQA